MPRLETKLDAPRLTDFLAVDHVKLQSYVGATAFEAIGQRYAAAFPQLDPGLRWFSRNLHIFLSETAPYSERPELAELAQLEMALHAAFEAPDVPVMTLADLANYEANGLHDHTLDMHPSAQRLSFNFNTTSLWSALQCGELPSRPKMLESPQQLIVWRQGNQPRFRMIGEDEAIAIDLALTSVPFSRVVGALAEFGQGAGGGDGAVTYLRGWVSAELVSAARILKASGEK